MVEGFVVVERSRFVGCLQKGLQTNSLMCSSYPLHFAMCQVGQLYLCVSGQF